MNDILDELCQRRREDALNALPRVPDFKAAFAGEGLNVIAELKKASPSEGVIRESFKPVELARELEASGAAALSVLCEPHRFLGSEEYLTEVGKAVALPILYKDFVTTPLQVVRARLAGASAVLLIARVLDDARLRSLLALVRELGFHALVETHSEDEIDRAVAAGAEIVGVNCRDLRTFTTDTSLIDRLIGRIPADRVRIAESGIRDARDIRRLREAGADGFLVGTALMRSASPGAMLAQLIGNAAKLGLNKRRTVGRASTPGSPQRAGRSPAPAAAGW